MKTLFYALPITLLLALSVTSQASAIVASKNCKQLKDCNDDFDSGMKYCNDQHFRTVWAYNNCVDQVIEKGRECRAKARNCRQISTDF